LRVDHNAIENVCHIAVVGRAHQIAQLGLHVGTTGAGGESEAHRRLKLYVARRPDLLSLRATAGAEIEHRFITGDTVDVLFRNHDPLRTVAEIEIAGTENIVIGVHQAIKYRSLAAAESQIRLDDPDELAAYVVSYEKAGQRAYDFAGSYNVELVTVDRQEVLAPAD
jgi:hypothetical protein